MLAPNRTTPRPLAPAPTEADPDTAGHRRLACAVLLRAVFDGDYRWFRGDHRLGHLRHWCDAANLPIEMVQDRAMFTFRRYRTIAALRRAIRRHELALFDDVGADG